jgi:hypothetical protein
MAVNTIFGSLEKIPQKGKHLDKLQARDTLFIWLNRLTAVPFVYHLLYACGASASIKTSLQVLHPQRSIKTSLQVLHPQRSIVAAGAASPEVDRRCRCCFPRGRSPLLLWNHLSPRPRLGC